MTDALDAPVRPAEPVPGHRRGRRMGDAPACYGGGRGVERVGSVARRSPQQERDRGACFRGELQSPRLRHLNATRLADDRAQSAVAKPLFDQRQQIAVIPRLGVDDTLGLQTGLVEPRREQVTRPHHPKHGGACPRRDARGEEHCRRVVSPARTVRRHLVKGVEAKTSVRQLAVQPFQFKRQHRPLAHVSCDGAECLAQLGDGGNGTGHSDSQQSMFAFCSL